MLRPRLQVITASTRPGRAGLPVARWFYDRAAAGLANHQIDHRLPLPCGMGKGATCLATLR